MKLGTATSVLIRYTLEDAVKIVADAGFDGIDIWGGRPHIYRKDYSEQQLKALRARIEDYGLAVSSFMPAFYRYPYSLSSANSIVRYDSIKYMCESMDNAIILGAPILLIVPDHSLFRQATQDTFRRMVESIDAVARYAAQYKIKLGLEVLHGGESDLIKTTTDAMRVIEELGHENLGIVVDTGALNLSNETISDVMTTARERLVQVHINDNNGIEQQNLIPGDGTFDFAGMMQTLAAHRFGGFLSAELSKDFCADPAPPLRTTVQRMRSWIIQSKQADTERNRREII